jgi:uncharacterized membrane protein
MANRIDAPDSPEFGRGLSFTDAIYGFAITLLVVNLDVPSPAAWDSWTGLVDAGLLGQLFGFVLSFVVIAVFWRVNFRLVRSMSGLTSRVLTANIVCAFFIVLIPFTTQGISDPGTRGLDLPTVVYALNIALASLAQTVMYVLAQRDGLVSMPAGGPRTVRRQTLFALATPVVFLVSIPVALTAGALPAHVVWLTLLVIGPLAGRFAYVTASRSADVAQT